MGSANENPSLPQSRIDCTAENIDQGLAKLVLSLIELLRQLLERQAIRRMEGGSLTDQQVEEMGTALMKLEQKIRELAENFGLTMADLNIDLGPLGNLLQKSAIGDDGNG
jgi:phosphoribosylaminoimidazole-succinocarboxamide synthase